MDRIGVGIIGGGRIADVHAPGYLSSDQARIVAVCDRDPDTLARRVDEWDADRGYADFQELLADPNVDLVDILTPHHLHAPMVIAAAKAGKHISVQKPMAVTVAECDEMIKACKYAGVHLRVFENFIFYPPFVLAKQLVDQGEIGEPLSLRLKLGNMSGGWPVPLATWLWRFNPELAGPGPTVFDDGYHKFSMAV
ncbi:Gfo/Idh/MocA family oxidoreductase, partial [bacterium]|nr:Gfo/Idh/MocA family oxidoreductase [bacterium]